MSVSPPRTPRGSLKRKPSNEELGQQESPSRRRKLGSQVSDSGQDEADDENGKTIAQPAEVLHSGDVKPSTQHNEKTETDSGTDVLSRQANHSQVTSCKDWEENLRHIEEAPASSNSLGKAETDDVAVSAAMQAIPASQKDRNQLASHEDWESSYEQLEKARRLIELLGAHVQLRRWVKSQFSQVSRHEEVLDTLFDHRRRLEERLDSLTDRRGAHSYHPEIERLVDKLHLVQDAIQSEQSKRNHKVLGANEGANTLSRKVAATYPLFNDIDVEESPSFEQFPPDFFDELAECQYLHWRRGQLEVALAHKRKEQESKRDEIFEATVAVFRARQQKDQDGKLPLSIFEEGLKNLRTSKDLLELDQACDNAAADLNELGPELRQAEVRLYDIVEDHYVTEHMIDPDVPESIGEEDDALDSILNEAEPAATPRNDLVSPAAFETSFTMELGRRLAIVLTERFDSAIRQLESCEQRLNDLDGPEDLEQSERDLAENEDQAFFLAKQKRTREVADAQADYDRLLREARDAGISAAPLKTSDFSSHASDGYTQSTVRLHVAQTNHAGLEEWIPDAASFELPKEGLLDGEAIAMLEPSEPEEKPDLDPVVLGESHSTVAVGKNKARIDSWLVVQKPRMVNEKDVFRRSGRRMSV